MAEDIELVPLVFLFQLHRSDDDMARDLMECAADKLKVIHGLNAGSL